MDNPHDVFYKSMDNLGKEFNAKRKGIQTDKDLSPQGREKNLAELEAEYKDKIGTLTKQYHNKRAELRQGHEKTLNPPKPLTTLDRIRAKINKAPGMEYEYFDDDSRTAAILESNQLVMESLKKSTFMNVAGRLSPEEVSSAMARAFELGDLNSLENLAEVAAIRGDEGGIKRGQGYIDTLKEQNMTPAQKISRGALKRLDLYGQLFDYGVKQVLEGREFVDLRGGESDQAIDMELAQIKTSMSNTES